MSMKYRIRILFETLSKTCYLKKTEAVRNVGLNEILAVANVTITIIGVGFGALAYMEYGKIRKLKKELTTLKEELNHENSLIQNATQKVIASYHATEIDSKIALLEQAVTIYPSIYNGFNSLGYAFLEKNEKFKAVNAFKRAIDNNPDDKAGYFDIATAYCKFGEYDLGIEYLEQAVKIDKSSLGDIKEAPFYSDIANNPKLIRLISSN